MMHGQQNVKFCTNEVATLRSVDQLYYVC